MAATKEDLVLNVTLNNAMKFMVVIAKDSLVLDLKSEISEVARLFSSTDLGEIISVQNVCNYELPHIYKVGHLLKDGDFIQAYTAAHVSNHAGSGVDQNAVTRARQRTRVSPAVEQGKESRRKQRHSRTQSIDKSLADEHQKNDVGQSPSTSSAFKEMLESPKSSSQSGVQAKKSVTTVTTWLIKGDGKKGGGTSLIKRKSTEVLNDTTQEACSARVAAPLNNNSYLTQDTDKMLSEARALSVEDNCDEKKENKEKKKRQGKLVESEDDVDEEEISRTKKSSQTGKISGKEESEAATKPVLQVTESEKIESCEANAITKKTRKRSHKDSEKPSKPLAQVQDKPVLTSPKTKKDERATEGERPTEKTKKQTKRKAKNEDSTEKEDRNSKINEEIPPKKTKKVKARMRRNGDGVTERLVKSTPSTWHVSTTVPCSNPVDSCTTEREN